MTGPRIAIAHDYLTQRGGAEKVVLSMSRAFPEAPIYTMLYDPDTTYPEFANRDVRVSRLNRVGPLRRHHRAALPVLPLAANSIFIDADVVLTSTSGWAHGFRTNGKKVVHCHSPARWLYLPDQYLGDSPGLLKRTVLASVSGYLRRWDRKAALSCDTYLAVSSVVQQRIHDAYGIDATIVPSPVAMTGAEAADPVPAVLDWLQLPEGEEAAADGAFYFCVSRLLPYKNVEQVVRAFAGNSRRLVLVGRGPEAERIRRLKTDNVLMLTDMTDANMAWLYRRARATIAASHEDFGLTPIEAGVSGRPSVVLRGGGFLDTVTENVTGVFFDQPEAAAIADALVRVEQTRFDADEIRHSMERFSESRFGDALRAQIDTATEAR